MMSISPDLWREEAGSGGLPITEENNDENPKELREWFSHGMVCKLRLFFIFSRDPVVDYGTVLFVSMLLPMSVPLEGILIAALVNTGG